MIEKDKLYKIIRCAKMYLMCKIVIIVIIINPIIPIILISIKAPNQ